MRRIFPLLSLAACTLAVSACATTAAPPMSDPLPPQLASCNADAAKARAIGQAASAAMVERARSDAGARVVRVLKPGQQVTMEYAQSRLNIDVDAHNVVINLRCG